MSGRTRKVAAVLLIAVGLLEGCGRAGSSGQPCSEVFARPRCQALSLAAARQVGAPVSSLNAIAIVPNPDPDPGPGGIDYANRTFLSVTLADGSTRSVVISCGGISEAFEPECMPAPVVQLSYPRGPRGGAGYTDIPENATPFPSLDPNAVATAVALRIAKLDIDITATGRRSVVIGRAWLPNGYLQEGDFALAYPWPSNILFNGDIRLDVAPVAGGPPLQNLYEHGWHDGVEEVEASISFDVAWVEPGAKLTIVDVVVR